MFSVIKQVVEGTSSDRNHLRSVVRPGEGGRYPIKAPLYAVFMAFYNLLITEQKAPSDFGSIIGALKGLAGRLQTGAHYETEDNRTHNINLTKGLIQQHFAASVSAALGHGPSLLIDFENAIRRSRIESSRYEFKQGFVRLDADRQRDEGLLSRLVHTVCGIANLGPDADGHIFVGVADKRSDAERISQLDGVSPHEIGGHFVVGIDREARLLGLSIDDYVQQIVAKFQKSDLTEPLKTQFLAGFDTINVHGMTVLRVVVPRQSALSFVGEQAYTRQGSSTVALSGQQIVAAAKRFPN